ncbi:MAG TPA: PIN domain-containing protein [Iamia sp.]|nr:PIN domain-containing protein [Iamia sp.]
MNVLDASVMIAQLDEHDMHHAAAVDLLEEVDGPLGASPFTIAESLVGPARKGAVEQIRQGIADLGVEPIELLADAPVRLAVLRAETGLRLPDCCVLLAAQQVGGSVLSFDDRLSRVAQGLGL